MATATQIFVVICGFVRYPLITVPCGRNCQIRETWLQNSLTKNCWLSSRNKNVSLLLQDVFRFAN